MPQPDRSDTAPLRAFILALVLGGLAGTVPAAEPALAQQGGPAAAARPAGPAPVPAAPRAKVPDPAFEASQVAFDALPEGVRREIQDALAWTGHYSSVVTGAFGRRTFDAILAYQRSARTEPDGILAEAPRAALLAAGRRAREAVGFALRKDAATGLVIGVPARLLPREQPMAQGTRWQSPDGRVTLETRALDPAESDLQATFDRVSAATADRKVTYRLKRPDFLVVTGETPTGRFYIRYASSPAGLRGFTLSYDKTLSAQIDPVVIAVANSFDPTPSAPVSAPRPAAPGPNGPPAPAPAPSGSPAASGRQATGILVAPGRVLTSAAALAACSSPPRIGAEPARPVVADEASGLALIAVPDAAAAPPIGIAAAAPGEGDLIAIGAGPSADVSVVPGMAGPAGQILAPLQPGSAGAPVFDRDGRLAGLVARYPAAPRLVAGLVPPTAHALVPPAALSAFLARNGIPPATDPAALPKRTTGEIARLFAGRVRRVSCD